VFLNRSIQTFLNATKPEFRLDENYNNFSIKRVFEVKHIQTISK